MSDHPTAIPAPSPSPSSSSSTPQHRLELNNWLQSHGWRERFTWDKDQKTGTDDAPTWHAACKFDDKEYGKGLGGRKVDAREEAARIALQRLLHEEEERRREERRSVSEEATPH